jgi:ferritin-like metal-binding protein YciE
MNAEQKKVVQYLNEAEASERALVRVLQSQIAMTPRGSYRSALETHLDETRRHGDRLATRLKALDTGSDPLGAFVGVIDTAFGQALALTKTPFDLLRGSGGEEKVLKNAKEACASEALEIATYTAIERLAHATGDQTTAELAASIREDEERMLERVLGQIPKLTAAVVGAEVHDESSYELSETGAADAGRELADAGKRTARKAEVTMRRTARNVRRVPGVAQVEGQLKGAVASEEDLAIPAYDKLNASDIVEKLSALSQVELAKFDSYERKNQNRTTVLSKISSLRGQEPWPGYDDQSAEEIRKALGEADEQRAKEVQAYERSHKNRSGVVAAAEREAA